jgi:hypothetical protein
MGKRVRTAVPKVRTWMIDPQLARQHLRAGGLWVCSCSEAGAQWTRTGGEDQVSVAAEPPRKLNAKEIWVTPLNSAANPIQRISRLARAG